MALCYCKSVFHSYFTDMCNMFYLSEFTNLLYYNFFSCLTLYKPGGHMPHSTNLAIAPLNYSASS